MQDIFGLAQGTNSDVKVFVGRQPTGATIGWHVWNKPRGYSSLAMFAISGGGGGGGGAGNTAGAAKGGGGGGGSSGISLAIFPMIMIPDQLYVLVGQGGAGGAGGSSGNGSSGSAGQISYVSLYQNTAANNIFLLSNNAAPGGGGGGTTAAAGAAGAAGTIATVANCPFSQMGYSRFFIAGVIGTAGGAQTGAVGAAQTIGTGCMIHGGTGGGGSTSADFAGGLVNAVANTPFFQQGPAAAGSNPGQNGFRFGKFPFWYGGLGGGSSNSTTGGAGGSAASVPGAGGGGGGGGTTVGGRGGDGGHGLVVLTAF